MVQHAEIKPECYYDILALRRTLGLSAIAIGKACRSGELRYSDRGGKKIFRGSWVVAWLEENSPGSNDSIKNLNTKSH